ncbi:MAG TPA: hypothetical protein VGG99_10490 [Acetobacteraceae bacterium]|jgi:hypothetical protein
MGAHSGLNRKVSKDAPVPSRNPDAGTLPNGFRYFTIPGHDHTSYRLLGRLPQQDRPTFDRYMFQLEGRMRQTLAWTKVSVPREPCNDFIQRTAEMAPEYFDDPAANNPFVPSGYAYLLQLVAHDTVFTRVPFWAVHDLATQTSNDRKDRLRLEALYGEGPDVRPVIFAPDTVGDFSRTRLQLGKTKPLPLDQLPETPNTACPFRDIARLALANTILDRTGIVSEPLIADPRNDDHAIISQLTMLFHTLHNTFVNLQPALPSTETTADPDFTRDTDQRYQRAKEATTLVYRHVVRYDLMQRVLHPDIYKLYNTDPGAVFLDPEVGKRGSALPLEFSHGAFRFAHCMSRQTYQINAATEPNNTTLLNALDATSSSAVQGNVPLDKTWVIEWSNFFNFPRVSNPNLINLSQRIGPHVPNGLQGTARFNRISPTTQGEGVIYRDLLSSGLAGLWSVDALIGSIQAASRRHARILRRSGLLNSAHARQVAIQQWFNSNQMFFAPPSDAAADKDQIIDALSKDPPLPFFVMFEAMSDPTTQGCRLGVLGSILIAEVIFGELRRNAMQAEQQNVGDLQQQLASVHCGFADPAFSGTVTMTDVIRFIWKYLQHDGTERQVPLI